MINAIFEPDRSVASLTLAELENLVKDWVAKYYQSSAINVGNLTPAQIKQIQTIIQAFEAENQINNTVNHQNINGQDPIDYFTENPVKVDGFLTRQEIYANIL
jgi:hypothetical protein